MSIGSGITDSSCSIWHFQCKLIRSDCSSWNVNCNCNYRKKYFLGTGVTDYIYCFTLVTDKNEKKRIFFGGEYKKLICYLWQLNKLRVALWFTKINSYNWQTSFRNIDLFSFSLRSLQTCQFGIFFTFGFKLKLAEYTEITLSQNHKTKHWQVYIGSLLMYNVWELVNIIIAGYFLN